MRWIIESLLDTDLYKFNMLQVMFHKHTDLSGEYLFKCRNKGVVFTEEMVCEINKQIAHLCTLSFTNDELDYLASIRFIKRDFVEFLRIWHPMERYVTTFLSSDGTLNIKVSGPLFNVMMFEIYLLEIVNEVYFRSSYDYNKLLESARRKLNDKIVGLNSGLYNFKFAEFDARRRLSREWQDVVIRRLAEETKSCVGTSCVYLAKKYGITPVGTMAHEWMMGVGQGDHKHNPAYSNWYALDAWVKEYGVLNGIALTDAITTDCFLRDFKLTYATLFSGVRHDSGDPYAWGDKMIAHYNNLGIDPKTKTLLFSDSLNFEKATAINKYFEGKAKVAFGIGTYIANDTDVPALNIVMKTTFCNGMDVAKVSDVEGKGMCKNPEYVDYLERCIEWRMTH